MAYDYYKTKLVMRIIVELSRDDAYLLMRVVEKVQDAICPNGFVLYPTNGVDKKQAVSDIRQILVEEGIEIPEHLKEPLMRFLEVIIDERAQIDELTFEYSRALTPLIHYNLFLGRTPNN